MRSWCIHFCSLLTSLLELFTSQRARQPLRTLRAIVWTLRAAVWMLRAIVWTLRVARSPGCPPLFVKPKLVGASLAGPGEAGAEVEQIGLPEEQLQAFRRERRWPHLPRRVRPGEKRLPHSAWRARVQDNQGEQPLSANLFRTHFRLKKQLSSIYQVDDNCSV